MKILFVVRIDARRKSGGDLIQAKAYKQELERSECNQVAFAHELSSDQLLDVVWDVVQLFNISRVYENMATIRGLQYRKLLLTPIMQPGFSFSWSLFCKAFVRGICYKTIMPLPGRKFINRCLSSFDGFVFLSKQEYKAFSDTFNSIAVDSYTIFVNGVSDRLKKKCERLFDYVVVGRIEPLKGVIRAIKAVKRHDNKTIVCCVGALNWYHPFYCFCFLYHVIVGNVIYFGKRSPEFVSSLLQQSRVLLNMSELEVSPLVDLEALSSGCKVISTKYSYTHLRENNSFFRVDVKNEQCIQDALKCCKNSDDTAGSPIATWENNSKGYIEYITTIAQDSVC